jgi:enoyl-CoA hydratase/3-hydroxyacyl-CoA dehydrogenase
VSNILNPRSAHLAVIGAGQMGSGIAQKMATAGFSVRLVDLDEDKIARGIERVRETLNQGVERGTFSRDGADAILQRISGSPDWERLADADLVVEAVFENLDIKREVFRKLESVCRVDAVLATNTSSFTVGEISEVLDHRGRAVGLHYFYHPAKNRLVEVVPTDETSAEVADEAWALQELLGKNPIQSADSPGFVVNRYFVPWLVEAVRMVDEGVAGIPTIEAASKQTFGIGSGPFELMNLTGIPIAFHAATTLGRSFGPLYGPPDLLRRQMELRTPWELAGQADPTRFDAVRERLLATVFCAACQLIDEGVGSPEGADIGARVGLRWSRGPFELINTFGVKRALELVRSVTDRWELEAPHLLASQAASNKPFGFRHVRARTSDGVATLTIDRPDALNALNPIVIEQLTDAFHRAASDPDVRGIVIAGSGKAFISGADIRYFVRHIENGTVDRIVEFTKAGHALLDAIDNCHKPVVARVHGPALGGGLEIALACDRIVATPSATFAFPETGLGVYPGLGGTQRTTRRIGIGMTKALIFTGRSLDAEAALRIGLVDEVVTHDRLDRAIRNRIEQGLSEHPEPTFDAETAALAKFFEHHSIEDLRTGRVDPGDSEDLARAVRQVRRKAPVALRIAERLIDEGLDQPLHEGLHMELEHLVEVFGTHDAHEGLSSVGTREPVFKGH